MIMIRIIFSNSYNNDNDNSNKLISASLDRYNCNNRSYDDNYFNKHSDANTNTSNNVIINLT